MKIRRGIAAVTVAGTLLLGVAGSAAFAGTATAATSTVANVATATTGPKACTNAAQKVAKWRTAVTTLDARIAKLQAAQAKAVAAHKDDLAKKIQARIDKAQNRRNAIEARIDKVVKACNLT